jgi:hypothetical protein
MQNDDVPLPPQGVLRLRRQNAVAPRNLNPDFDQVGDVQPMDVDMEHLDDDADTVVPDEDTDSESDVDMEYSDDENPDSGDDMDTDSDSDDDVPPPVGGKSKRVLKNKKVTKKIHKKVTKNSIKKSNKKVTKKRSSPKPIFKLKSGDLTKFGYHLKSKATTRHKALGKARKHYPHATMIRKLNALAILHKNKNKVYSRKAKADMNYLRKTRKN